MIDIITKQIPMLSYLVIVPLVIFAANLTIKKHWSAKYVSLLIFIVQALVFWRFTIDDTYISLRYAKNLADGYGLRYDRTFDLAPLEGYTNFLLVLIQSGLFLIGFSVESLVWLTKVIGLLFGFLAIIFAGKLAHNLYGSAAKGYAVLLLSVYPPLAFWSVGGLETTIFVSFIILAIYFSTIHLKHRFWFSSLFFILASLTRPDGFVSLFFAMPIFLMMLLRYKLIHNINLKPIFGPVALFLIFFLSITLFRLYYFGAPLPNTFYAKRADFSIIHYGQRIVELLPFIFGLIPLFFIFGNKFYNNINNSPAGKENLFLVSMIVAFFIISALIKREWMPGFRYEIPLTLLLFVWVSKFVPSPNGAHYNKGVFLSLIMVPVLIVASHSSLRKDIEYSRQLNSAHVAVGEWIKNFAPSAQTFAGWDAGAIPLFSNIRSYIEIHPEGILSPVIPRTGYDINSIFYQSPDIVALPKGKLTPEFRLVYNYISNTHKPLISVVFACDYIFDLYVSKSLLLNEDAGNEALKIQRQSAGINCPALLLWGLK